MFVGVVFSGCGVEAVPAATPDFVTATLPFTALPLPTSTPLPPTAVPTALPVEGQTTTEVNVRAEPSTASASLGVVAPFYTVQVVGKDASGKWFQVLYSASPNGVGWVRADFVQVAAEAEIPVWEVEAGSGVVRGVVIRGVNVRSGPGGDFGSLGLLNEFDVVSILGRDGSGGWMQIQYAGSPDGLGWVAADYLDVDDAGVLPVVGEPIPSAVVTEAGSAVGTTVVSVPTALLDGDSVELPLAVVGLGEVQALQVEGEVSWPGGDTEDWVGFSMPGTRAVMRVLCEGGELVVSLLEAGEMVENFSPGCNGEFELRVVPNRGYVLRLSAMPVEEAWVRFVLKIWVLG